MVGVDTCQIESLRNAGLSWAKIAARLSSAWARVPFTGPLKRPPKTISQSTLQLLSNQQPIEGLSIRQKELFLMWTGIVQLVCSPPQHTPLLADKRNPHVHFSRFVTRGWPPQGKDRAKFNIRVTLQHASASRGRATLGGERGAPPGLRAPDSQRGDSRAGSARRVTVRLSSS
jgi:hypothetical protein